MTQPYLHLFCVSAQTLLLHTSPISLLLDALYLPPSLFFMVCLQLLSKIYSPAIHIHQCLERVLEKSESLALKMQAVTFARLGGMW